MGKNQLKLQELNPLRLLNPLKLPDLLVLKLGLPVQKKLNLLKESQKPNLLKEKRAAREKVKLNLLKVKVKLDLPLMVEQNLRTKNLKQKQLLQLQLLMSLALNQILNQRRKNLLTLTRPHRNQQQNLHLPLKKRKMARVVAWSCNISPRYSILCIQLD